MILPTLLSTIAISLLSLAGVVTLALSPKLLNKIILRLVAVAAGTMLGAVFLHLLPEAHHLLGPEQLYATLLLSFVVFFLLEKLLFYQHCHQAHCEVHSFGYMNLIGDGLHNFLDGLLIAGAYLTSFKLGLITTLAVALHELPQELGDFAVLLHAGFAKKKALFLNLLTAATAIAGSAVGLIFLQASHNLSAYLIPFAAGGFLYLAAADLIPEISQKNTAKKQNLFTLSLCFLLGIGLMWSLTLLPLGH